jgi:hypothetical protein
MTHREEFELLLMQVIRRSPKHYAGWLTMTQGQHSITPHGSSDLALVDARGWGHLTSGADGNVSPAR